jgi:hypothetical protein
VMQFFMLRIRLRTCQGVAPVRPTTNFEAKH